MNDTVESLDYGARWLRDGLNQSLQAGAIEVLDVDVTEPARILEGLKASGRAVTWTHVFVRAASLALARNPDLHQVVAGNRKVHPSSVDICLSVAGDSSVTPTVIIEDAASKDLFAIGAELTRRCPEAVKESEQMFAILRRWGWIIPVSALRRRLMSFLLRRIWYRRRISGTFQISCLPQVDTFAPLLFNTAGALGIGRVRDRVIAENGIPVVRPMVTLICCLDHSVWNGMAGVRFLTGLRDILESGEFVQQSVTAPRVRAAVNES